MVNKKAIVLKIVITIIIVLSAIFGVIFITSKKSTNMVATKSKDIRNNYEVELYGEYEAGETYIKYIEENTTVSKFIELGNFVREEISIKDKNNKEKKNDDIITTGTKIILGKNENQKEYIAVVAGDVNGDGKANAIDIIITNGYRLGKVQLNNEFLLAGDINEDKITTEEDCLEINKYRRKRRETLLPEIKEVERIEIGIEEIRLKVGESYKINATTEPKDAKHSKMRYETSDEEIATVDEEGNVEAKNIGQCTITIETINGVNATCDVIVSEKNDDTKIERIELSCEELYIRKGDYEIIEARVIPESAINKEIEWQSSNNAVATVNEFGVIEGKTTGEAIISAKSKDGSNIVVSARIIVYIPAEGIELNSEELTVDINETKQILAEVKPDNATYKTINWSCENENVATVNDRGEVTGIDAGETKVIGETDEGLKFEVRIIITNNQAEIIKAQEIRLNKTETTINKGAEEIIEATVLPDNTSYKGVRWLSENENVAIVNDEGKIEGKGNGETKIIAITTDGSEKRAEIIVRVNVLVTGITILPQELILKPGDTEQGYLEITPWDASNKTIEWTSSNNNVATVSETGLVEGKNIGEAEIIARTKDGSNLESRARVIVRQETSNVLVTNIIAVENNIKISKDEQKRVEVRVIPDNATTKTITWETSNSEIATVGSDGTITGKRNGEAIITAKATDGSNQKAEIRVEVVVPAESISFNNTACSIDMSGTGTIDLIGTIEPQDATNRTITWRSNNTSIAKVDSNGRVTGVSNGTAVITASTENGKTASCTVTVQTSPTSITLNKNKMSFDMSGTHTATLTGTITPNTSNTNCGIQWSTSDSNVVTVTENGTITGISNGTAVITATTENGKTATCSVTVKTSPSFVSVEPSSANLDLSNTKATQLVATIAPNTANANEGITWTSSNTSIAKVSTKGYVTGVANGTAVITATTGNGKTATCNITVQTSPTGISLNKTKMSLDLSGTKTTTLVGSITPQSATNQTIKWKSGNTSIATVDSNGKVTGISNGTATITATTSNGKTATCTVTVQTSPASIRINKTSTSLDLTGTKTEQLKAVISPSTSNVNNTVTWTSSNTKIATVSSAGKVTAIAKGSATITAKTANGKSANCKVQVLSPDVEYETHVQSIGWQSPVSNGTTAGTTGQSKAIEAIKIRIKNYENLNISYRTHIQGDGWTGWSKNGAISGTTGQSKRMEAIMISLSGTNASKYDVYYRAYVQTVGWLGWAKNGEKAGTTGGGLRMEAIQIRIVKKSTQVSSDGTPSYINATTLGTLTTSNCNLFSYVNTVDGHTNSGSICVTDKYYVVTKTKSGDISTVFCVFDKNTGKLVSNSLKGAFNHANGQTYNPNDKCIYVAHLKDRLVSKIKASTITGSKLTREIITEPADVAGIAFDNTTKNWIFKCGISVTVFNQNLSKKLASYKVVRHTGQDIGAYKGLALTIDYVDWGNNDIYIHNALTGESYGRYHVSIPNAELESIDYDSANKRFVMVFNSESGSGLADRIYTTKAINIDKFAQ